MAGEHQAPVAAALPGGKILIAGGNVWRNAQEMEPYPTPKAEIFDPAAGTFTETGPMLKGRYSSAAAALPGGDVLVVGGLYAPDFAAGLSSAELYDPVTGTFGPTGSLVAPRWNLFAVTLADGRVLVGDGQRPAAGGGTEATATTEIYDPAGGGFSSGPTLGTARLEPAAALLPDGRVLIAGGLGNGQQLATSEIFDPCTGESTPGPQMLVPGIARATSLTNGRVLISTRTGSISELEEYDPIAGEFVATGVSSSSIRGAALAPLPGGRALIAGRVGSASESAAAKQAFVFSGVEAAEAAPAPTCRRSEPASPEGEGTGVGQPTVPTVPATPGTGSTSTSPAAPPPAQPPAGAKGVSAARAEGKRHKRLARRHHRRHQHHHHANRKHRHHRRSYVTTWPLRPATS